MQFPIKRATSDSSLDVGGCPLVFDRASVVSSDRKVVVVTGVTSGVGRVVASAFADRGCRVVGCARRVDEGVRFQAEIEGRGGELLYVPADLDQVTDCEIVVQAALDRYGRIDVLVNNAGGHREGGVRPSTEVAPEAWDATMSLNLRAAFLCSRAALRAMTRQPEGGVILNVASTQAVEAVAGMAAYNAAKAGLVQLSRSLAVEYVRFRISVNAILLGGMETPASLRVREWLRHGVVSAEPDSAVGDDVISADDVAELVPMSPDEVGRAFLALASDDARAITGATIALDRGLSAGAALSAAVHRRVALRRTPTDKLAER